jgi:1,2-phenylacetyl-CoA epoxidase catalytic subunit
MTNREPGHCAESRKWLTHFSLRSMTALHVSCNEAIQLTEKERRAVIPSIRQFQLGEGSRGQRLLERGQKYGRAVNDPHFAGALEIFIKEEQQHSRYLAAFLKSQSVPLLQKQWVDTIFRKLRGLAGLELSLTVLVTAELIAVPYYRALRGATGSPILRMICTRILDDEASHLKFQASMLSRVASERTSALQRALAELHRLFLLGTILIVWIEHGPVFEAAGYSFRRFKNETLLEFSEWNAARIALMRQTANRQKSAFKALGRVPPEAKARRLS